MNKKGFTLIELLAAIVIMVILTSIVIVSFTKMQEKRDDKKIAEFEREVSNAACTHVDLARNKSLYQSCYGTQCIVKVSTLIGDGLLSKDLKDPRNDNEPVDPEIEVFVTWNDGEKTCEIGG